MQLTLIQQIAIWILPTLFAITLHEAAHGLMAYRLGDMTAKMLGRVSLNPLKHIDAFGTILVPLLLAYSSGFKFMFGWAKPVPFTPQNFKNPRKDVALVAFAGPFANFLMACLWALLLKILFVFHPQPNNAITFIVLTAQAGIYINIILMILNLLPLPPLDGAKILEAFIPPRWSYYMNRLEPYGFFIILFLLVTGLLGKIMQPLVQYTLKLIFTLFFL